MRIAIYENLPPGGAKRASFEFGRYLAARHQVDLYRLSLTDNRAFDLAPLVRQVHVYPYRPLFGLLDRRLAAGHNAPRSYTLFGPLRRLHRRIASDLSGRDYDVVLAHTDAMTQAPYLLRWLRGTRSIYYCHEVLRITRERSLQIGHRGELARSRFPVGTARLLEDQLVRRRLSAADADSAAAAGGILVNSRYTREQVWSAYARDAEVCAPGVDSDRFRPERNARRDEEVLSVGGPPWLKGHALAIEALSRIPAGHSRPALRIVMPLRYDSTVLERLAQQRAVTLRVERGLDEASLVTRYQAAIATLCTARLEPFGLTALESMACGTPVVALDEAGYRESVLPGRTGLLVDPDPDAIAGAISGLIDDPRGAAAMGEAGREWVAREWTWDKAGRRLEIQLEAETAGPGMSGSAAKIDGPSSRL